MAELPFHHLILTVFGICGFLHFYGSIEGFKAFSESRRLIVGLCSAPIYIYQAIGAFPNVSIASSMELVGFIGCILGIMGSMRIISLPKVQSQLEITGAGSLG